MQSVHSWIRPVTRFRRSCFMGLCLVAASWVPGPSAAEPVSPQKEQSPRADLTLDFEQVEWLARFRGSIRAWRCDWALDERSEPLPGAVSIRVNEYRYAPAGFEQWAFTWQQPFRFDLTPDLNYVRLTDDVFVEVNGNSRGPRAIVLPLDAKSRYQTMPDRILRHPVEYVIGRENANALRDMVWHRFDSPGQVRPSDPDQRQIYSGELLASNVRWRKIRAAMLVPAGLTTAPKEASETSTALPDRVQPGAIDLFADLVDGESRRWDGTFAASYRVLQWHAPSPESAGQVLPWSGLPRLAAADEICSRPNAPGKSYRRMSLMLLDFCPDPNQQLLPDWEKLLPKMRIADMVAGTARLNSVVDRDQCAAWGFMKSISAESDEFVRLLTTDLRLRYPGQFQPVPLDLESTSDRLGTMEAGTSFCALPQAPAAMELARSAKSGRDDGAGDVNQPQLLKLVDGIRAISQHSPAAETRPNRRGHQPVTPREQAAARSTLSAFVLGGMAVSSVIIVVHVARWRRRKAGSALRWILVCAGLHATSAFAANDDSDTRAETDPRLTQARMIVRDHCSVLSELLPELDESRIWATIVADRQSLVEAWRRRFAAAQQESSFQSWMKLLEAQYQDIVADPPPAAGSGRDSPTPAHRDPRTCATLHTALVQRRANCYALALLYHVQCRLADLDTRMLALPGHVMLCTVRKQAVAAPPVLEEVYDAIRRRMLSTEDIAELREGSWSILEDRQLPAVLAFNVGTSLSRSGALAESAACLEIALHRQFPFPDALKNLCLTYWHQHRFSDIVERCVEFQGTCDAGPDIALCTATSADARRTRREIDGLQARALAALGRSREAMLLLEHRLGDRRDSTDFRLYRVYVEIKRARSSSPEIDSLSHQSPPAE